MYNATTAVNNYCHYNHPYIAIHYYIYRDEKSSSA